MAHFHASNATVSFRGDDGEWHELGVGNLDIGAVEGNEPKIVIPKIVGVTVSCSFTPTPAFYRFIVGLQLHYGLRDLHRNLARLARWPYLN